MQVRYFVHHDGQNRGPFSYSEIEDRLGANDLFPTDYVYVNESGDWMPILEFIMIFGPKTKSQAPVLLTVGAQSPEDDELDWRRFALSVPARTSQRDPLIGSILEGTNPFYPARPKKDRKEEALTSDFPPPLAPPRPALERRIADAHQHKSRVQRPRPEVKLSHSSSPGQGSSRLDTSARATVEVAPAKACRLDISVLGQAQVGEEIEVVVRAVTSRGDVDPLFSQDVVLECNHPLEGMRPLTFWRGEARLRVRCLEAGHHEFSLRLPLVDDKAGQTVKDGRTAFLI